MPHTAAPSLNLVTAYLLHLRITQKGLGISYLLDKHNAANVQCVSSCYQNNLENRDSLADNVELQRKS